MSLQLDFDFDMPRRRKPPVQPPPARPPTLRRRLAFAIQRAWAIGDWIIEYVARLRTVLWIMGILIVVALTLFGIHHWQINIGDYRMKIWKQLPAPTKGWEPSVHRSGD